MVTARPDLSLAESVPEINLDAFLTWHGHNPATVVRVEITPGAVLVTHQLKAPTLTSGR